MERAESRGADTARGGAVALGEKGLWPAIRDAGFDFVTGVPDSEFKGLIAELEGSELREGYVLATREDNALALAVGAHLAGRRPLVFMESSGVGNAIDALTSLAMAYGVPMVIFVAWAGYRGRDVPHHNAIGEPLRPLFESLGVPIREVRLAQPPEDVAAALGRSLEEATQLELPAVVLGIPKKLEREGADD
jgi:phosphonopyruvate decarboxylase